MNNDLLKKIDASVPLLHAGSLGGSSTYRLIRECRAEIERLSKPYVPMTDEEISQMMQDWYNDTSDETSLPRFIETAVIKRAGLEIKQ